MPVFTDQAGRTISLTSTPNRIISLVPSQTELLYDLGLGDRVVGVTKFCIHPDAWFRSKTRVGGTKKVNMDVVASLQPDLILANKEENDKEQVLALERNYPVWITNITNLEDACEMILEVSLITGSETHGKAITRKILENFALLQPLPLPPRTVYLIWQKPYMTVGGDTFINAMMECAGFENAFGDQTRYPETSITALRKLQPDLLLLPGEPFPFTQKHVDELSPQLPGTRILLVDGEMFSWYGSRLLHAPAYFTTIHDQLK